jgi:phage terminase small subunit
MSDEAKRVRLELGTATPDYVEWKARGEADAVARDLAARDPMRRDWVTRRCAYCHAWTAADELPTQFRHDDTCVWARAVALVKSERGETTR